MTGRRGGFTLIEMLAVLLLSSLVLGVALQNFVNLSNASNRATTMTRDWRRQVTLLDRVAADLERTLLVRKPEDTDPLSHPWIFRGERRYSEIGADRLMFVVRRPPRQTVESTGDLALVAYVLWPSEDEEGFELWRWKRPGLARERDLEFPPRNDPGYQLVADGLADFGFRFEGGSEDWTDRWDSSQLVESGELPSAVEIEVELRKPLDEEVPPAPPMSRRVRMPIPPLDLAVLFDPVTYGLEGGDGSEGEDDDEGPSLADCLDLSSVPASLEPFINDAEQTPFCAVVDMIPSGVSVSCSCE